MTSPVEGMTVTVLALTLNEIDGVKAILPQIDRSWYDQLLVVDGGSTDGTVEWCRDNGYPVYVQQRQGIRFAYIEVLPMIAGDIVVTISPDGNCPPEAIPGLVGKIRDGYDLVRWGAAYYFQFWRELWYWKSTRRIV
jgi:glycosyltransferase involved in cell wall biosynthesis